MIRLIFSILVLSVFKVQALQTYILKDQQKTGVTVSRTESNRISVQDDRIHQVFGVHEFYAVETDEQGGQVFLKALFPEEVTPFTLTIITEKGLTHDLRIQPQDIEAQSILLKPVKVQKGSVFHSSSQQEILDFIKDLALRSERDTYGFINHQPHDILPRLEGLKVIALVSYETDDLKGIIFQLKNTNPYDVPLRAKDFALPKDRALAFKNSMLSAFSVTELYVVRGKS